MSKGESVGMLPVALPAVRPAPGLVVAHPAQATQPSAPLLTQHGQPKGSSDAIVLPRPNLARSRSARLIGPSNGRGLSQDQALLCEILRAAGWDVSILDGVPLPAPEPVVLQVHLEVPASHLLPWAQHNVIVPNPEYWRPEWAPLLRSPGVRVWAKTGDAERIFLDLGARVERTGWRSVDRRDEAVPCQRAFLHVAGNSPHKGTDLLLRCWRPDWPPLTIVTGPDKAASQPNITIRGHLSDEELRRLQNEHAFHVYPARYEGYGHAEWEGLSCGAVVFAPDGAPFNEHPEVFRLIAATPGARLGLSTGSDVSPEALSDAIRWAQNLSDEELARCRQRARQGWEQAGAAFRTRIKSVLAEFSPRRLITLQSPHERCGIAEYGRHLDRALKAGGMEPAALPLSVSSETLWAASGTGTILLVHFEPGLLPQGTDGLLQGARERGARVIFCCHFFEPAVLSAWGGLVDRFVLHRPYAGVSSHEKVVEIPLGCPEYETSEERGALRSRLGLPQDQLVLTTLGFLTPWKRLPQTLGTLLHRLPPSVFLQVLTPPPFRDVSSSETEQVHAALARYHVGPDRVLFSTEFRSERDLLDRVAASDLGFLFHGQNTGSVSAATKSFVSARTPLVATGSTHASDLHEGVMRVDSFDPDVFAAEVVRVAADEGLRQALREGMHREYGRLRMGAVAQRYLDLMRSLS